MSHRFSEYRYQNGDLWVEQVRLKDLAQAYGTPLYVYSLSAIEGQIQRLQKGLAPLNHLICYAVKANSNINLLRKIVDNGCGLDLVSGGELFRAHRIKAPAEKIVFSGVGKTATEIKMALSYQGTGIKSLHVESVEEARLINQLASELKLQASICVRFNPNVDPKTHPYISTGLHSNKFGLNREEILDLAEEMKELKHLKWHGLSIHIGSQILELSPFEQAYLDVLKLAHDLRQKYSLPINCLDLGGGVGVPYRQGEVAPSIEDYTALICRLFEKEPFQILIEPGRNLVANSGVLLTRVLYRKPRPLKDFLVVDASMAELIRPCLYEAYHDVWPLEEKQTKNEMKQTDIVGPVCESSDFLAQNRDFPISLSQGDFVAVMSAGAYGFSMSGQFNSRPRVAEILVSSTQAQVIRRRETFDDLTREEML